MGCSGAGGASIEGSDCGILLEVVEVPTLGTGSVGGSSVGKEEGSGWAVG